MKILYLIVLLEAVGIVGGFGSTPNDTLFIFPAEKAPELIRETCLSRPPKVTGYWTPQPIDLQGIQDGLPAYLKIQEVLRLKHVDQTTRDYYRQHPQIRDWNMVIGQVTGIKKGSRKLIFMNFITNDFHQDLSMFVDRPAVVLDGGPRHFRVVYDPSSLEFIWYDCNW